jgi:GT2 family glycosyltransferase
MKTNALSVIIVNWNGERFLERCLAALMAQTVQPHEIILVDNASSDKSLEIVRRFPSVRLIALDQNTGFARGNNLAIEAASKESEWIALINPDAFAEPNWLEELLAAAEHNRGFSVFASRLVEAANPAVLDGTGDAYHVAVDSGARGIACLCRQLRRKNAKFFRPALPQRSTGAALCVKLADSMKTIFATPKMWISDFV